MEKLLSEILAELKYQTKLLETIFDNKRANGAQENLEAAMNMVLKMPFIKQMGVDPSKLKNAIIGTKKDAE